MSIIENAFKIIVFVICSCFFALSLKRIWKEERKVQFYFYLIFYLFFCFPLLLQFFLPNHSYSSFVRANEAMADSTANLMYDVFCLLFAVVIYCSGAKSTNKTPRDVPYNKSAIVTACLFLMILAFLYTLLTNSISSLFVYGSGYKGLSNVNETFTGIGTICFLIILSHKKNTSWIVVVSAFLLMFSFCWFVGKRYIVAETVLASFIVLAMTKQISGKKFIAYSVVGTIAIMIFCIGYAVILKGNFDSLPNYLMVDFSRQYTLVYQFHCSLIGKSISVNKYDAFIYLLLFWVPRSLWPNRPYPFVNQLTYSLIPWSNVPSGENVGWATTCSIFSDLYDSFNILGIVVGFLLFVLLFKLINNTKKTYIKILVLYSAIRLATVQISSAIIPIVVCFAVLIGIDFFTNKRKEITFKKLLY